MNPLSPKSAVKPKAAMLLDHGAFEVLYGRETYDRLSQKAEFVGEAFTSENYLSSGRLDEVEVIFSGWGMPEMTPAFLGRLRRLKIVFYAAGSVRYFATPDAWNRGIRIVSAASLNAIPVAEFAFSQIIAALKHAWPQAHDVKQNRLFKQRHPHGPGTYASTVGLLSLGRTGRLVANWLKLLSVKVVAYDPTITRQQGHAMGIEMCSMEEVFARSDVVSCHLPVLPATMRLVRGSHLDSLKPGSTFINTARGEVVAEDELIEVFTRRTDLFALLDVTAPEPPVANSPLFDLPNVMLTPHIAGSVGPECRRLGQAMVEEFDRYLAGDALLYEIDRETAATLA